jgi:hypothetical protein
MTHLFPCLSAALNLGAVIFYLWGKDYARAIYWIAAATITISTLFIGASPK